MFLLPFYRGVMNIDTLALKKTVNILVTE